MDIKTIFSLVNSIVTAQPNVSEKVTQLNQNYAQFKLSDGRLVTLRREKFKKVTQALVLSDKDKKVVASGLKDITKELAK